MSPRAYAVLDTARRWVDRCFVVAAALVAFGALVTGSVGGVFAQQTPAAPMPTPSVQPGVQGVVQATQPARTTATTPATTGTSGPSTVQAAPAPTGGAPARATAGPVQAVRREVVRPPMSAGPDTPFDLPWMQHPVTVSDVPDKGDTINLSPDEGPILVTRLLDDIVEATGWNVIASPGLETETIRFWFRDVRPKQALEVLRFNGIHYEYDPESKFLYVMLLEEYLSQEFGALQKAEFEIEHADVLDMESVLTSLLSKSGRLVADPRTGNIFVWDTEGNIEAMRRAVDQLDVPLEPRVFDLKYMEAEKLSESVQTLISERGVVQVDPRANALVVSDLPARQDMIGKMIEALDRELETRTWTLNYAEVDVIEERLQVIFPEEMAQITTDEDNHQVSVTAIPTRIDEIDRLVAAWDVRIPQVMIEAYLVSARTEVSRELGIDWSYFEEGGGMPFSLQSGDSQPDFTTTPASGTQRLTAGRWPHQQFQRQPFGGQRTLWLDPTLGTGAATPYGVALDPTSGLPYLLDPEFRGNTTSVVLDYLDETDEIDVLARPRITVRDGQEAVFENVEEVPYQQGGYSQFTSTDTANPNFNRVIPLQMQFIDVGTTLKVTPRINEHNNILLDIEAEHSTFTPQIVIVGDQTSTVPQKRRDSAETAVLVNDRETIVLGGLRFTEVRDNVHRVPVLGAIPVLGRLFRNTIKEQEDRELLIFITTTIVDEFTHPEAEKLADMEESTTKTRRHNEKGIFDRAKDRVLDGKNEIDVAIGHTGFMHCDGERVTLEDLEDKFRTAEAPGTITVMIQIHPRAPKHLADDVADLARVAGHKVVIDTDRMPFVPDYDQPNDD